MSHPVALPSYSETVRAEWVDYNGHMRDAFYMLIFSLAIDGLIDFIGLPDAVRKERHRSIYTLEAHLNYLHEIKRDTQVRVDMRVLGHDAKRIHVYLEMFSLGTTQSQRTGPVAAGEQMLLHVDTSGPRGVAFDPDVKARVHELALAHATLPAARFAGRVIALPCTAQLGTLSERSDHA
ncbi:thioesterase family protein [Paraburkholderia sprentiae WSM5005]|uniref:Thioesterase family protein n=1 Tax=Paraburkholderia sprentiae WSM5005 TaxID=754502 RepID=A0A1L1P7B8_9BURK|nr:thioesterase family protein [Paraburkholderia sprentiae]APA88401.1 thioesterase family protein [Paraburkholderia sprentiae WSM5005]